MYKSKEIEASDDWFLFSEVKKSVATTKTSVADDFGSKLCCPVQLR